MCTPIRAARQGLVIGGRLEDLEQWVRPRGGRQHVFREVSAVVERARLGPGGVRLGGVQQPGVDPGRAAVAVGAEVGLVRRAVGQMAQPRAPPATSRPRPRETRTSRSTARATTPLWEPNGAAATSSAWATAATSIAGTSAPTARTSATPRSRAADSASRGRPSRSSGRDRAAATVCRRASTCSGRPGQRRSPRQQLGRDPHRVLGDLVAGAGPDLVQRRRRALEHGARVGTAEQRLGGGLRRGTPQPPVAQQRVDPVPGRRERRRHAFEAPQRVQGGRGGRGHGRKR